MTLNETKHTPGPWKVVKPNNPGPQQENDRLIATKDKKHVAEIFQYQNHKNQNGPSLANARLIAAAPELLEALKNMVDVFQHAYNSPDIAGCAGDIVMDKAWLNARDTLAKVK